MGVEQFLEKIKEASTEGKGSEELIVLINGSSNFIFLPPANGENTVNIVRIDWFSLLTNLLVYVT